MTTNEQQIVKGDDHHRYFTTMLNMAEDELDPYQYRLLAHYVRWAGHGGTMPEGIRDTADKCKMSIVKTRAVRDQLSVMGYLQVTVPTAAEQKQGLATEVVVVDRWAENIARYSKGGVLNIAQGTERRPVSDVAQGGVLNIAPLNNNTRRTEKKPKELVPSGTDADAVQAIDTHTTRLEATRKTLALGEDSYPLAAKYLQFLTGTVPEKDTKGRDNGEWHEYQLRRGMDAAEIAAFGLWLADEYDGEPLRKPAALLDYAGRFRADLDHALYLKRATYTAPPIVEQPPEPTAVISDAERADVLATLAALAEKVST